MVTASDRHRGSGCPLTLATPPCVHGGSRCYASSHPPNSEARVSGNRSSEARRIRPWRGRGTRGRGCYRPCCSPVLDGRPVPRELPDDDGLFSIVARGPHEVAHGPSYYSKGHENARGFAEAEIAAPT